MLSRKIRTSMVVLVASLGFAGVAVMPAVSQAQWHNLCINGHCTTHSNYTYGNPCTTQSSPFSPGEPSKEEKEAEVHQGEVEKSFYGCDSVAPSSAPSLQDTVSPVQPVQAVL
jgi:hypothetical protein